jgi:hypothetical protein
MTDLQSFILFITLGLGLVAILGDSYTTSEGLTYGATEGNPVARAMFKKFGQALTCFIGAAGYLFSGSLIGQYGSFAAGETYALGILGLEVFNTIRNYRWYTSTPNYKNKVRVPVNYGK